jgi:hypothetical protein
MTPCQTCRTRQDCATFDRCPKATVNEKHPALAQAQREKLEAEKGLKPCPTCKGLPALHYEPGSTFSSCLYSRPDCPCLERVPDEDYRGLVAILNRRNR